METNTGPLAVGVDLIMKHFLQSQLGERPKDLRCKISGDWIVVMIQESLPLAEKELLEKDRNHLQSLQKLREQLFTKSEHLVRSLISDLLQREVQKIHYIFGTQPENMDIIMQLGSPYVRKEI